MSAWVGLAALVVQTMIWFVGATYVVGRQISKLEVNFSAALLKGRLEIDQSIAEIENDFRDQISASAREQRQTIESVGRLIGSDVNTLRDRLHEHEITTRDDFVRRDSFFKIMDDIKALFARLEGKIDRMQESRWGPAE